MWTGMRFTHFLDLITTIVKWTAMSKLHFRLHNDCIKDASAEMGFNNILVRCFYHHSIAMHIYMAVNFYFPTRSSLLKMNVLCLCISIINENWINIPVVSVHFFNLQNNKIIVDGSYNEEYKGRIRAIDGKVKNGDETKCQLVFRAFFRKFRTFSYTINVIEEAGTFFKRFGVMPL